MPKNCYGVRVHYPLSCEEGGAVCRHGKVDLAASDKRLMKVAGDAVPWVAAHFRKHPYGIDTGAGPFGCGRVAHRDLEFDAVSFRRGFTKAEANKLARAARRAGAYADVKRTECKLPPVRPRPKPRARGKRAERKLIAKLNGRRG